LIHSSENKQRLVRSAVQERIGKQESWGIWRFSQYQWYIETRLEYPELQSIIGKQYSESESVSEWTEEQKDVDIQQF